MSRPKIETLWRRIVRALGGREKFPRGTPADAAITTALLESQRHAWHAGQAEFRRRAVAMLRKWAAAQPHESYRQTIDAAASHVERMP